MTDEELKKTLELLLQKEKSLAVKEEKKEQRERRWWLDQFQYTVMVFNRQRSCRHLKGGGRHSIRDYAVTTHVHPDGTVSIRCMLCGWEAWNNRAFTFKWQRALAMAKQSTNTPSASERTLGVKVTPPFELIPFKMPELTFILGNIDGSGTGNKIVAKWEE